MIRDRVDWRIFRVDRMVLRTPNGPRFTPRALPQGGFVHVAASFDGTRARLYVDGVLAVDVAQQVLARRSSFPLQIGSTLPSVLDPLRGALDEVAFFNRALSALEVASLATNRVCTP